MSRKGSREILILEEPAHDLEKGILMYIPFLVYVIMHIERYYGVSITEMGGQRESAGRESLASIEQGLRVMILRS